MDERERERQRAGVSWALGDLEGLLARGVISMATYEGVRRDYDARLRWLRGDAAGVESNAVPVRAALSSAEVVDAPGSALLLGNAGAASRSVRPAPALPSPTPPALPTVFLKSLAPVASDPAPGAVALSPAADTRPGGGDVTGLWINLALFLGAFFVVMASLIFVRSSWSFLGAGAKAVLMASLTAAFVGGGLVCLRLPRVRPAGQAFLAIGATLLPLDIVGFYSLLLRGQGLSATATLALGAAICALFYGALALGGVGRVYALAATVATVAAWGGALAVAEVSNDWLAPAFLPLPLLLLAGGHLVQRTTLGRAAFGPIPAWAAQSLLPVAGVLLIVAWWSDLDRRGPVAALALILVFYGASAATQRASRPRGLHVAAACLAGLGLIVASGWWALLPAYAYAALTLGAAWATLAFAAGLRRSGPAWATGARAATIVGWTQAITLLLPWGFFVDDGRSGYWALLFAGVLAYAALNLWGLRQPWMLYPLAAAGVLTLFHVLRIGPSPGPYGYAWAYTLAAFSPVVIVQSLRRQGQRRAWDWQLSIISQLLALGATGFALVAGNRFQTAAVLWLFVAASVAIVASERRVALLILPNLWGLGAVAALVALAGSGLRWAPSFYTAVGLLLALGLQGWRGVPTERRPDWFMAQRWAVGLWATGGAILGGGFLLGGLGSFLASGELRELVLDSAYGPVGLAMSLCGAALAADAIMTLRRPTGYSASAVVALTVLMGIARITPNNPQAYAVPLGLYLLLLSVYVAYERDLGSIRMPVADALLSAAVLVILGTTLVQALVHPWRFIFLGLAEGLVLLGVTAFLRRRFGVALALLFLTLTTLRAVFDVGRALPNWVTIGLLGLLLLATALIILLRRDRLEGWGGAMLRRWGRLT